MLMTLGAFLPLTHTGSHIISVSAHGSTWYKLIHIPIIQVVIYENSFGCPQEPNIHHLVYTNAWSKLSTIYISMCKHHTQPAMSIFVKSETKVKSSPSLHRTYKLSTMGHSYCVLVTYYRAPTMYSTVCEESQWLRSYILCTTLILLYLVSEGAHSFGNARWSSHFTVV